MAHESKCGRGVCADTKHLIHADDFKDHENLFRHSEQSDFPSKCGACLHVFNQRAKAARIDIGHTLKIQ